MVSEGASFYPDFIEHDPSYNRSRVIYGVTFRVDGILNKPIKSLSDQELFDLLEATSEEMKRRNGLLGPSVSDIRNKPVEEMMKVFLDALSGVGIEVRGKRPGDGPQGP